MKNTILPFSFIIILQLTLSSCSSIINGPNQKIYVNSRPPGAKISVDGQYLGDTPKVISLRRQGKNKGEEKAVKKYHLSLEKDGFKSSEIIIKRKLNALYFGNILFLSGAPIGFIIDAANGSMYKLKPAEIYMPFNETNTSNAVVTNEPDSFIIRPTLKWALSLSGDYTDMRYIFSRAPQSKDNYFKSGAISLTYIKSQKISFRLTHSRSLPIKFNFDGKTTIIFPHKEFNTHVSEKWWMNDTRLELLVRLNRLNNKHTSAYFTSGLGFRATWYQYFMDPKPVPNSTNSLGLYYDEEGIKSYDDLWFVVMAGLRGEKRFNNIGIFLEPSAEATSLPDILGGGEGLSLRYRLSLGASFYFGKKERVKL
jgi:hypothetical protein